MFSQKTQTESSLMTISSSLHWAHTGNNWTPSAFTTTSPSAPKRRSTRWHWKLTRTTICFRWGEATQTIPLPANFPTHPTTTTTTTESASNPESRKRRIVCCRTMLRVGFSRNTMGWCPKGLCMRTRQACAWSSNCVASTVVSFEYIVSLCLPCGMSSLIFSSCPCESARFPLECMSMMSRLWLRMGRARNPKPGSILGTETRA